MSQQELYEIVSRWYLTGLISESDRARLKEQYLSDLGNPQTCTVCPDFWRDVQVHFRIQLKENGFTIMKTNRKYIINPEAGYIRPFGQAKLIVNDGENNDNVEVLTDEKAEALKVSNPEFFEQNIIIENPDYVPEEGGKKGKKKEKEETE